jgi:hypothetical protein
MQATRFSDPPIPITYGLARYAECACYLRLLHPAQEQTPGIDPPSQQKAIQLFSLALTHAREM